MPYTTRSPTVVNVCLTCYDVILEMALFVAMIGYYLGRSAITLGLEEDAISGPVRLILYGNCRGERRPCCRCGDHGFLLHIYVHGDAVLIRADSLGRCLTHYLQYSEYFYSVYPLPKHSTPACYPGLLHCVMVLSPRSFCRTHLCA